MDNKLISLFQENMDSEITNINLTPLDVIIGIPIINEDSRVQRVVDTAQAGLVYHGLSQLSAIVLVGPEVKDNNENTCINNVDSDKNPVRIRHLHLDPHLSGRGMSVFALMELATRLGAKLILLLPDLVPQEGSADIPGNGFSPHWIVRLYDAIVQNKTDLALARFNRHPFANPVENLIAYPLITGIYGFRIRQPIPSIMALSYRLMRSCLDNIKYCSLDCTTLGFDSWLTCHAIMENLTICEVCLGIDSFTYDMGNIKQLFRQVTAGLLTVVKDNQKRWINRPFLVKHPNVIGPIPHKLPPEIEINKDDLQLHFKSEFDHFDYTLFNHLIPDETRKQMEQWADGGSDNYGLTGQQWNDILQRFAIAFSFSEIAHPSDTVDGLFPLFLARFLHLVGCNRHMEEYVHLTDEQRDLGLRANLVLTEQEFDCQADAFINEWPIFQETWRNHKQDRGSYLPRLGAWEFVPNVDIVVPQELKNKDGTSVWAYEVYQEILQDRRAAMRRFLTEDLDVENILDTERVLWSVGDFMTRLDDGLSQTLFPYSLETRNGVSDMIDHCVREFSNGNCFQLTPDAARYIVLKAPPRNLSVYLNANSSFKLLNAYPANDLLAMAAWTDRKGYLDRVLDLILHEASPDWFHIAPLQCASLNLKYFESNDEVSSETSLLRMAGRMVSVSYLQPQAQHLSTLWFILKTVKRIAGIEAFSEVWQEPVPDKQHFAEQLVASIRGHWGRRVLSAHNIFENHQQRSVVQKLWNFAAAKRLDVKTRKAADLLAKAAEVYHICTTLPDNTFIPLSAWTWASFGSRGGQGPPTPLSSLVERDWATRDFLLGYLESAGRGDERTLRRAVSNLMKQGRESSDLGEHLLGVTVDSESIVALQTCDAEPSLAKRLIRPTSGPILKPVPEHAWESRYVLNAAAVRLQDVTYIIYRAFGEDKISRLGLAWSKNCVHIDGRLDTPIFVPENVSELGGCEDPRITIIGDRLYMLYTAFDGDLAQIAMASISQKAFLEKKFDQWTRHGLAFPGVSNKDAVLYPETFNGKYAVYHRMDPAMWISFTEQLTCPCPRLGHKIVISPRSGMMWDGIKIGAGAQPIKTEMGWLNIYHGVDYDQTYRLGVLLMDLHDPSLVIYQSPNPILEPEADFEIGKTSAGDFWVPRVVFTCGAVVERNAKIAEVDDSIFVYYGAADTAIGVAKARIGDLLPI